MQTRARLTTASHKKTPEPHKSIPYNTVTITERTTYHHCCRGNDAPGLSDIDRCLIASVLLIMANMQPLAPYIQQAHSHKSGHVLPPAGDQIFGDPQTAPRLDKTRTNRIIVYPGSFNPPHRGHLHLLNHAYYHGVPDLNVVAAIGRTLRQ